MSDDSMLHPWDRRKTEPTPAWQSFRYYLEMGQERTLARMARERPKKGQGLSVLRICSAAHDWPERARAYDAYRDSLAVEATIQRRLAEKVAEMEQALTLRMEPFDRRIAEADAEIARARRVVTAPLTVTTIKRGSRGTVRHVHPIGNAARFTESCQILQAAHAKKDQALRDALEFLQADLAALQAQALDGR